MRMCIELLRLSAASRNFAFRNGKQSVSYSGKVLTVTINADFNGTCTRCGICKFNWYDSYAGFKAFEHVVFIAANYS